MRPDLGLVLKPGTDGALACAVMHVLFRDGLADRDYLARYTDDPAGPRDIWQSRTPAWAAAITGLTIAEIETFARLVGTTGRTFFRLGYGFARQRNGAVNMHAALSHRGGHRRLAPMRAAAPSIPTPDIFKLDKSPDRGPALPRSAQSATSTSRASARSSSAIPAR